MGGDSRKTVPIRVLIVEEQAWDVCSDLEGGTA